MAQAQKTISFFRTSDLIFDYTRIIRETEEYGFRIGYRWSALNPTKISHREILKALKDFLKICNTAEPNQMCVIDLQLTTDVGEDDLALCFQRLLVALNEGAGTQKILLLPFLAPSHQHPRSYRLHILFDSAIRNLRYMEEITLLRIDVRIRTMNLIDQVNYVRLLLLNKLLDLRCRLIEEFAGRNRDEHPLPFDNPVPLDEIFPSLRIVIPPASTHLPIPPQLALMQIPQRPPLTILENPPPSTNPKIIHNEQ